MEIAWRREGQGRTLPFQVAIKLLPALQNRHCSLMPDIHRHDWIHSLLLCWIALFIVQLCYNISDTPLPTGKYQSAIPTTSSPGQNPDCRGGDWESSRVCPEAGPCPRPLPSQGRLRPFPASGSPKAAAAAGQALFPGWLLLQLLGGAAIPSQSSSCWLLAADVNLHVPANELPIPPVRARPGQLEKRYNQSERSPVVSETLFPCFWL